MRERIQYLDIIRIVATVGVLCNHIPLAAIHLFDKQATDIDRFLVNGNVHVMHPAVLLFVMVTGALLLQQQREISYRKVLTLKSATNSDVDYILQFASPTDDYLATADVIMYG